VVEKGANIDLLFRNGLKDYEVLPPADTWRNILPVIRKKQRPVIFLRNAALIAVLLSMAFLAYRYGKEMSVTYPNPLLAGGEESVLMNSNNRRIGNSRIPTFGNNREAAVTKNEAVEQQIDNGQVSEDIIESEADEGNSDLAPEIITGKNIKLPELLDPLTGISYDRRRFIGLDETLDEPYFEEPKIKKERWSITAMASPTYFMHPELSGSEISNQISSSEQSRISYSGGVSFAYKISRKLSIQSGLYYSSIGNEVGGITSFAGFRQYDYTKGDHNFEVLTSNGRILTENADVFLLDYSGDRVITMYTNDVFDPAKANLSYINSSLYQNFSYIEMPFILRYKLIDKSIDFNLIGGLSYNLLINNTVHTMIEGSRYNIGKTADLNQFMVSSSMGMGIEYNLSEKFSLNLEPTFRYYLNPFSTIPGMKSHPYSIGVFSGLSYKF
jgi:hypothetical protein